MIYLILSIMSVSSKIQLHARFLFVTLGWGSLGRIQDTRTTFFVRFIDAGDIIIDVRLEKSKRRRSLRQDLNELRNNPK